MLNFFKFGSTTLSFVELYLTTSFFKFPLTPTFYKFGLAITFYFFKLGLIIKSGFLLLEFYY